MPPLYNSPPVKTRQAMFTTKVADAQDTGPELEPDALPDAFHAAPPVWT
jgi:hypothetical protein